MSWTIRQMCVSPAGRYGDDSALLVFLASIRCCAWGHSGPREVGFTSGAGRCSHHAGCWRDLVRPARPVANRAHRRNNLGRPARGRSRGAITRLDVGMGIRCQIISEHFWIDGGRLRGRARDRLAWSRPDRAACNRGKGRCRCRVLPSIQTPSSYPCAQAGLSRVEPASDVAMTSIAYALKANNIGSCATTKNRSESRRHGRDHSKTRTFYARKRLAESCSRRKESNEVGHEQEKETPRDRGPAAVACRGDAKPPRHPTR
jgi:hypothetical protein